MGGDWSKCRKKTLMTSTFEAKRRDSLHENKRVYATLKNYAFWFQMIQTETKE